MQAPQTFRPELEQLLAQRPAEVAAAIRKVIGDVRPCVRLETARVAIVPLAGTFLDRLRRRPPPAPVLPPLASKLGGIPYVEGPVDFAGAKFLGQINFADARAALARQGFPVPRGLPDAGILGVDIGERFTAGRARWYSSPTEAKAVNTTAVVSVGKYEAAVSFRGSWSLRGLEWFDAVPKGDDELWNYMNDLEIPGVDEDGHWGHKLLGHPNEALNEHYGFEPVPSRSDSIREYDLLWRIDYDNAAGFSWGTNWLYVVIHRDDLARGALENAIVTGANA
jgi:hypothetical protein